MTTQASALSPADLTTANAQLRARIAELEGLLEGYRADLEDLKEELAGYKETHVQIVRDRKRLNATCIYLASTLARVDAERLEACAHVAELEGLLEGYRTKRDEDERHEITRLKQEVFVLQTIAAIAQQYNERPYGVENGALRIRLDQAIQAYGDWVGATRVSSNQATPAPAPAEETQAGIYCPATVDHRCVRTDCIGAVCRGVAVPRCSRCGQPLNNVSPGYSVVGGRDVCALCLVPGDREELRAR